LESIYLKLTRAIPKVSVVKLTILNSIGFTSGKETRLCLYSNNLHVWQKYGLLLINMPFTLHIVLQIKICRFIMQLKIDELILHVVKKSLVKISRCPEPDPGEQAG
jgi:hypothetical protein